MPQPGVAVPAAHLRNIEARVQEVADLVRGVEARVRAELSEDLGARVDLLARRVEALEGELGRPGPATCAEALGTEARRAEKLREYSASAAPCGSHPDPTSSTPTCYNVAPAPVNSNGQVPGESQMLFAVSPEYVLAESIWDASIFIGLDGFHHLSDTFTLVCLLMKNMILQLVLTSVVWEFMCKDPAAPERLQDLLQFRLTSGHHVSSSVGDSRTSMIAEVCREAKNDALHISHSPNRVLEQFQLLSEGLGSLRPQRRTAALLHRHFLMGLPDPDGGGLHLQVCTCTPLFTSW
ncbi:unnamed protein product [Prorocentrum cordatum]|uniref:Uncharacterized protein n=1 Tax=Prorocentrum cordatum TaxID=2364126 RepID=A0ABN9QLE7_9DINO|nr:unnamed protein product [Polarella glacialis]